MHAFIGYMFLLGLGTSLHCVSMCGPLVLTYAVKGETEGPWYRKLTPNVAYQSAKIVSYMLIGTLLGFLGVVFKLDAIRPWVMFMAGVYMIILGLGMTGEFPWAQRFTPRPPKFLMTWLMALRRKSNSDASKGENSLTTPVAFGLMTGLLPCGPLMAAEVSAAASGSVLTAALGMAAFGLGTAPLMVAFGTAGSLIPRVWKERMMVALAVGVMLFGLVFINRGLTLVGSPVNFNTAKQAVLGTAGSAAPASYKTGADGVVEVPLVVEGSKYIPSTLQIPAGKPVRLIVDRKDANSCSKVLVFPQLGVQKDLADNGQTIVDLPATKSGTYTMTCGMGMLSGALLVGAPPARAAGGISPLALLLLAVTGAGVAVVIKRRRTVEAPPSAGTRHARPSGSASRRGSTAGGGGSSTGDGSPSAVFLGFSRAELVVVAALIASASVLGLVLGGGLR